MDYKFVREVTGKPIAQCEAEASLFGDWLSSDIGNNKKAVEALLKVIEKLELRQLSSHKLTSTDYSLTLDQDEVELHFEQGNWDEDQDLPEGTEIDEALCVGCGLVDFKDFIVAWHEFIAGK